jgi:hypothetical protein
MIYPSIVNFFLHDVKKYTFMGQIGRKKSSGPKKTGFGAKNGRVVIDSKFYMK